MEKIPFRDRKFYKTWISSLIKILFSVVGDTMAIWGSFLILNIMFFNIWPGVKWSGINYFIQEGKVILISFSFLSAALYYSTRQAKINFYNIVSSILLLASAFFYTRAIAIQSISKQKSNSSPTGVDAIINTRASTDSILYTSSISIFIAAIVIYFFIILHEKKIENSEEVPEKRNAQQNALEKTFTKNKR